MKTLDRYIGASVAKGYLIVLAVLLPVFSFLIFVNELEDVGKGTYDAVGGLVYVLLTAPGRMLDLAPVTALLGSIVALGGLAAGSELLAIRVAGVSVMRLGGAVMKAGLVLMLVIAFLAQFVVPPLNHLAETRRSLAVTGAGTFMEDSGFWSRDGLRYINVKLVVHGRVPMDIEKAGTEPKLVFVDGNAYYLDPGGQQDMTLKFGTLTVYLKDSSAPGVAYKRRAAPTAHLARSDRPKDIAEFQWRISAPVGTVLLTLLAVPLSRTAPRRGRYARVFIAVLVYVVYYNLGGMAQTWLEEGWVEALPGMMWVHTLPAGMLILLLWWPVRPPSWRRRMARLQKATARLLRR